MLAFPRTQADTAPGEALVVSVGLTLHPTLTQEPGATGRRLYMLHPTLPGVLLELDSVSAPIVAFQGECAPRGPWAWACQLQEAHTGQPPTLTAVSPQWFCWSWVATLPASS